jgi:integrase/recombinase XerD
MSAPGGLPDARPARLGGDARKAGRVVSKAMHRLDPRVPVLPIGDGVARAARQHNRSAHLYTDEEVQRILQAALAYPSPKAPWRPIWLFTMLILAYCAGLRGGEIAHLKLGDINLREVTIEIRETKFFKHRRLPLAPGVMARPVSASARTAQRRSGWRRARNEIELPRSSAACVLP